MSGRTLKALTLIFLICATIIECASMWLAAVRLHRRQQAAAETNSAYFRGDR